MLVVDDDEQVARLLELSLRRSGYEVLTCTDPVVALEVAELCRPHVALLDFSMPEVNGLDLLRQFRQRWPALPVAIATGHQDEHLRASFLSEGACAVVDKPFSPRAFRRLVAELTAGAG